MRPVRSPRSNVRPSNHKSPPQTTDATTKGSPLIFDLLPRGKGLALLEQRDEEEHTTQKEQPGGDGRYHISRANAGDDEHGAPDQKKDPAGQHELLTRCGMIGQFALCAQSRRTMKNGYSRCHRTTERSSHTPSSSSLPISASAGRSALSEEPLAEDEAPPRPASSPRTKMRISR